MKTLFLFLALCIAQNSFAITFDYDGLTVGKDNKVKYDNNRWIERPSEFQNATVDRKIYKSKTSPIETIIDTDKKAGTVTQVAHYLGNEQVNFWSQKDGHTQCLRYAGQVSRCITVTKVLCEKMRSIQKEMGEKIDKCTEVLNKAKSKLHADLAEVSKEHGANITQLFELKKDFISSKMPPNILNEGDKPVLSALENKNLIDQFLQFDDICQDAFKRPYENFQLAKSPQAKAQSGVAGSASGVD